MNQDMLNYWRAEAATWKPAQLAKEIRKDQSVVDRNDERYPTLLSLATARLPILLYEQQLRSSDVPTEAA